MLSDNYTTTLERDLSMLQPSSCEKRMKGGNYGPAGWFPFMVGAVSAELPRFEFSLNCFKRVIVEYE